MTNKRQHFLSVTNKTEKATLLSVAKDGNIYKVLPNVKGYASFGQPLKSVVECPKV